MEHSIYGFQYDYIRHRGTCLVLSRTDTLRYEHFERIELRMMEANEIPGLLPFESEEIDFDVKLRYEMTGKRMLSQWMKTGRFTLEAYYRFLLKCAGTIDDSKTYMLREDGYWLHEHFMFIDGDSTDEPLLLYVPIRIADAKPPVREQFKELALRLSACIDRIEGSGFSSLLSALHRDTYEFQEIRKLLGTLLSSETANEFRSDRHDIPGSEAPLRLAASDAEPNQRFQAPSWIRAGADDGDGRQRQVSEPASAEADDCIDPGQHAAPDVREPLTGRQRLLGGAAAGAGLLLLWSFYPPEADEGLLSVWTGLTILMLDALFVWAMLRPNWPGTGKLHALAQTYNAMEEREMTGLTSYLPVLPKEQAALTREAEAAAGGSGESSAEWRAERAILPRTQDATVLLRPEALAAAGQPSENEDNTEERLPELEAHKGGAVERIRLTRDRFVIGRERGVVDYTEDTAGASKQHVEIVREDGEYFAKDLGSKNGTLWNHEPMVPYKWYPLKDGASLQVVHTRFVFVWDHAK